MDESFKSCVSTFKAYFARELPRLASTYQWNIPEIEGFDRSGERGYAANIALKIFFNQKWQEADEKQQLVLAKTVVSDWGGVRNNRDETLKGYLRELANLHPALPIKGVASYSKIFSITNLEKYAIYDARVAGSLNAIQVNAGVKNGMAFNYLPGRNNVTGNAGKKIGFACKREFKVINLVGSGWARIKINDTYRTYLGLLTTCLEYFPDHKLYDLEMVLFANAETECGKAMQRTTKA